MKIQSLGDFYDENIDNYYAARTQAFMELITKEAEKYGERRDSLDLNMSIEGFCEEIEEEFEFPEESKWIEDKYQGVIDDIGDQKMELERDRKMGM